MKIELNVEASITIGIITVASMLIIFVIVCSANQTKENLACISAGLVQKQAAGEHGLYWTKP